MSGETITVETGCRLHFGLLSFGQTTGRNFGGIGVMLERPSAKLSITASDGFRVEGPAAKRVAEFAQRFFQRHGIAAPPDCTLQLLDAIPAHLGLGSGTQTALAVAAGLRRWLGLASPNAAHLAADVGRAKRSSIGTHGFLQGGLMLDAGRAAGEPLGKIAARVKFPREWCVVLILPQAELPGLHGNREQSAFAQVRAVPQARSETLLQLAAEQIVPAVERVDFARFSDAIYQYGHEAGLCFESIQGGPFATQRVADRIDWLRKQGVMGVGQSSWGPGVFAWTRDDDEARQLANLIAAEPLFKACRTVISRARNGGAEISVGMT